MIRLSHFHFYSSNPGLNAVLEWISFRFFHIFHIDFSFSIFIHLGARLFGLQSRDALLNNFLDCKLIHVISEE
jgi:hypothetical protein